ncbi:MAG: ureidoglycolate lyase [Nitrososphaerota archaeon]|nr:ureidoglycolate lyase [Nitrososphaerota archaeon]
MYEQLREVKIKPLDKKYFEPYGTLIEFPGRVPDISNSSLDYWGGLVDINIEKPQVSFLLVKRRDFLLDKIERHVKITEVFIPMEGVSVFPIAPPRDEVPINEIEAFILDGSKGIVFKKGVWHWVPFPVTEKATFAVILSAETIKEDLDIREIKPPIRMLF